MLEYSMFERLPFRKQAEIIAQNGTVVAQRNYNQWLVTLYKVNNSFVELWSGDNIQVYGAFRQQANTVAIFEPYLDKIDVQEIMRS
ncbi:hypothetical protein JAO76_09195 [Pontibacter sp. BT310]|jgi:tRNA(Ile2) C34 agmatinyltransferase TiaS|uniref:Uncharacterized protein n=2 Tax=Hymenobacteraceae TaxID=1853232 RepID=A0ABS6XB54_9BACT|nr:hypothetical protein [Pontibacter sp. BT310]MBW3365219.1 hypothetical protein [Pontibacter populi]